MADAESKSPLALPEAMQLRELRQFMKTLIMTVAILVIVLGFAGTTFGQTVPPQPAANLNAMTVAELEKAGDAARASKDYEQAIDCFETAIRKDKKNAVLYNKLGLSQLKAGNNDAARASFEKAMKRNSKYADAVNNVGAVYFVQRNLGQATRYFKKAVALEESRPAFHVNLGAAWFGQNKLERAMTEYRRALQLDPDALARNVNAGVAAQISTSEERARYDYMMAKIYAKLGNTEECLRCLRKAKEGGYRNLANVYKDEEFLQIRQDQRLAEIAPPPVAH
jgi:tetratricopeptide (TPR) repeat protein